MIGFNHALTGALIAKIVPWPIALPLAVVSHFLLDMMPHYGIPARRRNSSKFWRYFFTLDFIASLGLGAWAIYFHHYAMFFCGLAGTMPDFVWVAHVIKKHSFDFSAVETRYEKWHIRIQRYEFPKGLWIELPLAAVLFYVVVIQTV